MLKFEEKPSKASLEGMRREGVDDDSRYLANMGVYVFRREALFRLLSPAKKQAITHIGHHVVPNALAQEMKVYAYLHDGGWVVEGLVGGRRSGRKESKMSSSMVGSLTGGCCVVGKLKLLARQVACVLGARGNTGAHARMHRIVLRPGEWHIWLSTTMRFTFVC